MTSRQQPLVWSVQAKKLVLIYGQSTADGDQQDIAAGPVATVELEDHLPPGLHGYWSNAVHK